jgi:alpha-glucoside transport system substrate-binding protein
MRPLTNRRRSAVVAAVLSAGLVLAGCADDSAPEEESAGGTWPGAELEECAELEQLEAFGDLSGRTVGVYTSILPPEADTQEASYELFTTCTGAEVDYEGSDQFETQLVVRVQAGNAPDIAYIPQPGLTRRSC